MRLFGIEVRPHGEVLLIGNCRSARCMTGPFSGPGLAVWKIHTPYATDRSIYSRRYAFRNSEITSISIDGSFPIRFG